MYEMGARQYDPAIARWCVIDPVVHYSLSTYNAFDNNPVYWADPSGADAYSFVMSKFESARGGSSTYSAVGGHFEKTGYTRDDAFEHDPFASMKPIEDNDRPNWFQRQVNRVKGLFFGKTTRSVEIILEEGTWEFDTEAIGDFLSGGEVSNMRERLAIYQEQGLNSYLYQAVNDAHREELLNFVGGGYGVGSSVAGAEAAIFEGAVESNFKRFVKKIPANSKSGASYELLNDGNYLFQATSPGQVPGSSALYQKWVNPQGVTINMLKTTYAPDGSIIHIKSKM